MPSTTDAIKRIRKLTGHDDTINQIAWSPDQKTLASASYDNTIKLWDLTTGGVPRTLYGHRDWVSSVSWSPDGKYLASASGDNTIRIWDVEKQQMVGEPMSGHRRTIFAVAWSPDGRWLATASGDNYVGLWDVEGRRLVSVFKGHAAGVTCVAWSPNGKYIASGSIDHLVRIWDASNGRTVRLFEGHAGTVTGVAWSPDGIMLASSSHDMTVRLWGKQTGILEGHTDIVTSVSFSADNSFIASKSLDGTVRVWQCNNWQTVQEITELASVYWTAQLAFHPRQPFLATLGDEDRAIRIWKFNSDVLRDTTPTMGSVRYTNAKVVLLGDSGVGKSSLADVLRGKPFQPTESTHGRHVFRLESNESFDTNGSREIHEILLWDMAGQPSYRLLHQLHLNEIVVALVVFDQRSDTDPFAGVRHWDRALRNSRHIRGEHLPLTKYLVSARTDRGGVGVSKGRIENIIKDLAFDGYFETSAREGWAIAELSAAIRKSVNWENLPKVSSTILFQSIKNFLNRVREKGREENKLLYTIDQLYDSFLLDRKNMQHTSELRLQFETCIGLVESQGLIRHFNFSNQVLLQPEMLDAYASAIIAQAKDEADGLGVMAEEDALNGKFRMPEDERLADPDQEKSLLIATVADLLRHEIALRDEDDGVNFLVFPSQSTRAFPDRPDPDDKTVIYGFEGPVLNIYTTLAVRLWHTGLFESREMYENAVFFTVKDKAQCRVFLQPLEEGRAEMQLHFEGNVGQKVRLQVEEYTHAHLVRRALPDSVKPRHIFVCQRCHTAITQAQVDKRREYGHDWMNCPACEMRVSLRVMSDKVSASRSLVRQGMILELEKAADSERERQLALSVLQAKEKAEAFDIFLCHNNRDKEEVRRLCTQLREHGILPWLDETELIGGEDWQERIEDQIEKCKTLAFFVGKNGPGEWQRKELAFAMDREVRIIPVILPEAPRKLKLPMSIANMHRVDLSKNPPDTLKHLIRAITGKQSSGGGGETA